VWAGFKLAHTGFPSRFHGNDDRRVNQFIGPFLTQETGETTAISSRRQSKVWLTQF
jgi:hypothetical protein